MRITALQPQRRSRRRVSVFVDGRFLVGLSQDTVAALGLKPGMEFDRAELERIAREEQTLQARNYAFLLLSYKARTQAELSERLTRKGFPAETVKATLDRLTELKMVNDEGYARQFVQDRVSIGHKGKWRVRQELAKRGITREQAEAALAQAPSEVVAAKAVAEKYRERNQRLEPLVLKRRLYALLARRGFSPDTIQRVMDAPEIEP
jgi:regulatory protein